MKRQKEFFLLSNKKSIFEESEDSNDEKIIEKNSTSPLMINVDESDEDELEQFLRKNTQDWKRKNSLESKSDKMYKYKGEALNENNLSANNWNQNDKDTDSVIIIDDESISDILCDESLFFDAGFTCLNNPHLPTKNVSTSNNRSKVRAVPKRKPRETQIEKNLKKLAQPPIITTESTLVDTTSFNEPIRVKIMVMVFFKGITKKYFIDSQDPLIESLTPKIKENYPEIADTPLHFFKFYDEDNKPLNFSKTPENLQLKYADSIDCIVVPSEGNEEDFRTDMISVKFQDGSKHPVVLKIKPSNPLGPLFDKYLNKTNKKVDLVKFYFDGDQLSNDQSPCDIDMEEDFCIDVVFL